MFELSPYVQETFEKFRTVDNTEELQSSSVLFTHGLVVMNAMDEILTNLDDRQVAWHSDSSYTQVIG